MGIENDQVSLVVTDSASDIAPHQEDPEEKSLEDFDEEAYLQAFPDVAQAIADGRCVSPLQHYEMHGRHENRLTNRAYLQGLDRVHIGGHVDFYGYHPAAGGWFFCAWASQPWDGDIGSDQTVVNFESDGIVTNDLVKGFLLRDDLSQDARGFVMFVYGSGRPLAALKSLSLRRPGVVVTIAASPNTQRFREAELTSRLGPIIGRIYESAARDVLSALLARKPYTGNSTLAGLSVPVMLEIDEVIACPPGGTAVMGWFLAKPGTVRSIRFRSGSQSEPFVFDDCIKLDRPDVIAAVGPEHGFEDPRCGFIGFLPGYNPSRTDMYIEVETTQREVGFRKLQPPKLEGLAAIKRLLSEFDLQYGAIRHAFDRIVGPAVGFLNQRRLATKPRVDTIEFGRINPSPRFSIIVPLYGRLDFLESQMAFIANHEPAFDFEFIFVLDDPPKRREAERMFNSVYARFGIPFRVLLLDHNLGFAPANNVGLRAATGAYVCFLNSDVFPGHPDWVERLADRLEAHPDLGAIGPLLLYGDGSVQHEGMTFKNLPEFGNWPFGDHPRKGQKKGPMSGLRKHICITGACMLMRTSLARELGGFDEAYIIGDFEDSDICLRLYQMGLDSAVDLDVELYHLERKSQASSALSWRMNLTLYNAWVHQNRWAGVIARHPLQMNSVTRDSAAMEYSGQ